ncbi:acetylcholinesterase-like [Dermacentor variabilis]|uniref:acetylcholinesterase-like n=1 Tax=Dermacentor variabilis TaxID=34621 RepID=UPI003F5BD188
MELPGGMAARAALGLLVVVALAAAADDMHVERVTTEGRVRGKVVHVLDNKVVEEYRGIPFAEPPVGKLRFKPPQPKTPWRDILDATAGSTACPQVELPMHPMGNVTFTEDCLYLNVWVPEKAMNSGSHQPVLVWFHGGGFTFGSASEWGYNGAVLAATTGVLVVSGNYRLNILGFLSANSPEAPGNAGLLDQVAVLKWVQRNINSFGGDPDRVTLFGESAGGTSAHAHVMSPMSEGLFKRAVLMSGTMYNIDLWDMVHESMVKGNKVANIVGCSKGGNIDLSSNAEDIIDCFRKKSADELVKAAVESIAPKMLPFLPTYHDAFLPRMPLVAMNRGFFAPVDILAGVTSDEGAMMLLFPPLPDLLPEDLDANGPDNLDQSLRTVVSKWVKESIPDIEDKYTNDAPEGDKSALRRQHLDYASDRMFNCPLRFTAEKHSERGNRVFVYVFGHKYDAFNLPAWMGAPHSTELQFVFGVPYAVQPDSPDGRMSEAFMRMLASFSESGVPELPNKQKWPKYTKRSPTMVLMDNNHFNETKGFRAKECERWRSLF